MNPLRSIIALSGVLALAACAGKNPPPTIAYDSGSFTAAGPEAAPPKPVQIVKVPEPLPLPGQLQPPPTQVKPDQRPPTARVDAANKSALEEPSKAGYIDAIQVYPYTPGALYRLYAAPEEVSDIALQPGETLISIAAGDTVRWVVGDTTSGAGATKQIHVLVKPFAPGLKTNLVITTDKRSYHLALESTPHTAMAAVSWTYPLGTLIALKTQNSEVEAAAPAASGIDLQNLRFRYEISGDRPPWRPLRAFDDGSKVYIEFPTRIDQGEAPPLFVIGPHGNRPQQVVRISRTDAVAGGAWDRR